MQTCMATFKNKAYLAPCTDLQTERGLGAVAIGQRGMLMRHVIGVRAQDLSNASNGTLATTNQSTSGFRAQHPRPCRAEIGPAVCWRAPCLTESRHRKCGRAVCQRETQKWNREPTGFGQTPPPPPQPGSGGQAPLWVSGLSVPCCGDRLANLSRARIRLEKKKREAKGALRRRLWVADFWLVPHDARYGECAP
jgi:hypothetical protein